jgi:hypothetical protein
MSGRCLLSCSSRIVRCVVEVDGQAVESAVRSSSRRMVRWGRRKMRCDSQDPVGSRQTGSCLAQSCSVRQKRCADEAGKAATIAIVTGDMDGYVSVGTTRTAAAAAIRVCTLCTQAGWLELVYDDVCGKQADRVVYAGRAQKQEVEIQCTTNQAERCCDIARVHAGWIDFTSRLYHPRHSSMVKAEVAWKVESTMAGRWLGLSRKTLGPAIPRAAPTRVWRLVCPRNLTQPCSMPLLFINA